jgi:hypothetical protein
VPQGQGQALGQLRQAEGQEEAQEQETEEEQANRQQPEGKTMTQRTRFALSGLLASVAFLALGASSAAAAEPSPWWNLNTSVRPAVVEEGDEATLFVRAANLGNAPTATRETFEAVPIAVPTTLTATLPAGVEVLKEAGEPEVSIFAFSKSAAQPIEQKLFGFLPLEYCQLSGQQIACKTEPKEGFNEGELGSILNVAPIAPYEYFEMRIRVKDQSAQPGATYTTEVSGGGTTALSRTRPLPLGSGNPPFGVEDHSLVPEEEGGSVDAQAGSHPYQLTATFNLNQNADERSAEQRERGVPEQYAHPPATPRNLEFLLPPGQIGNPTVLPKCSAADFATFLVGSANNCPPDSAIGVALIAINEPLHIGNGTFPVPLFNLQPAPGEPARFGFALAATPVILDTTLRSEGSGAKGEDYGVTVSTKNTTQLANFIASTVTFWGVPGDKSHDSSRGWGCLVSGFWGHQGADLPCEPQNQQKPPAFLTLPTDCNAPYATTVEGDSWTDPTHPVRQFLDPFEYSLEENGVPLGLIGCNQLPYAPRIESKASADSGETGTGLDFNVDFNDEGLLNHQGIAQSDTKKAVVTLPEGLTINPSVGEGLGVCTPAQIKRETLSSAPGQGCPNESKLGTLEVTSPLVEEAIHGSVFLAQQDDKATSTPGAENPFDSTIALYLVLKNQKLGVLVKKPLKVEPDPTTGQLVATLEDIPQLPLSHFNFHFREGARAPLITPAACGTYTTAAKFYPWSDPQNPRTVTSSFQITRGVNGGPCPTGGVPPFHPHFEAGALNNDAGSFSPFNMRLIRADGEQDMTKFSSILPPGELGSLAGVARCPDSAIAIAKSKTGKQELASPSCPSSSLIGHTLAGAGVGESLTYVKGQIYLGGPYHGDPLSVISVTPAVAGPFDAGTVVVQLALTLNPRTAEVEVDGSRSDPIPHILDGIVLKLRDLRVYVDRQNFTLNPTSCEESSAKAVLFGSNLNVFDPSDDVPVDLSSRYQASNCASLGFKPKLALNLKGGTKRGGHPGLLANYTPRKGDANVKGLVVRLPRSAFLDQAHIRTICTRVQFAAKACPAGAQYGFIKAWTPLLDEPLEGPVYLRSSNHKLPDLVFDLHGLVDVEVDVRIDSAHGGIRATLESAPDAPLSKVVLRMQGGKKGLIVNSRNLCGATNKADVEFEGQNGKLSSAKPVMRADCGGKGKGHRH